MRGSRFSLVWSTVVVTALSTGGAALEATAEAAASDGAEIFTQA